MYVVACFPRRFPQSGIPIADVDDSNEAQLLANVGAKVAKSELLSRFEFAVWERVRIPLKEAVYTSSCEVTEVEAKEGSAAVACCKLEGTELDYGLCVPLAAVEVSPKTLLGLLGGADTPTTTTGYGGAVELPAERECEGGYPAKRGLCVRTVSLWRVCLWLRVRAGADVCVCLCGLGACVVCVVL